MSVLKGPGEEGGLPTSLGQRGRVDAYTASVSVEAALALGDMEFLEKAFVLLRAGKLSMAVRLGTEPCLARLAILLGQAEGLLADLEAGLSQAIFKQPYALVCTEALLSLRRIDEAEYLLLSFPPPLLSRKLPPKAKWRQALSRTKAYKFLTSEHACVRYEKALLAWRHTVLTARVKISQGHLEVASLLLKGASGMTLASLYRPLARACMANSMAQCGLRELALQLLEQPPEHLYFPHFLTQQHDQARQALGLPSATVGPPPRRCTSYDLPA